MNRPLCKCHGELMARNGKHPSGKQKWQCAIGNRGRAYEWYWTCTNLQLAAKSMRNRRLKALQRMAKRAAV